MNYERGIAGIASLSNLSRLDPSRVTAIAPQTSASRSFVTQVASKVAAPTPTKDDMLGPGWTTPAPAPTSTSTIDARTAILSRLEPSKVTAPPPSMYGGVIGAGAFAPSPDSGGGGGGGAPEPSSDPLAPTMPAPSSMRPGGGGVGYSLPGTGAASGGGGASGGVPWKLVGVGAAVLAVGGLLAFRKKVFR